MSPERERREEEKIMPITMANYVSACSQGQRTHFAWTKIFNYRKLTMAVMFVWIERVKEMIPNILFLKMISILNVLNMMKIEMSPASFRASLETPKQDTMMQYTSMVK